MRKKINVTSEIKPLKKVLLHRPGNELLNLTPNTLEELLRKHIDLILQYRNNIETIVEGNEWVVWNKKSKNK